VKVAVIANPSKSLGGGLLELRRVLEQHGVEEPIWHEVPKSRKAPAAVERALAKGAELVFAWGGDGLVQRCIDTLAGTDVPLAIVPAGTTNLLATNLKIPADFEAAVAIGLDGERRRIDVGRMNGERFGVIAGAGIAAAMSRDADGNLKDKLGRVAYIWAALRNLRTEPFGAKVKVDGVTWFDGEATCILVANLGELFGDIEVFANSQPNDGMLEVGVVTADGLAQWTRTTARTLLTNATESPFVQATQARSVDITMSRKVVYELDGGDRKKTRKLKVKVEPAAVTLCVLRSAS
jgi:YegS/Rv2252/BmrU family lipid kinase